MDFGFTNNSDVILDVTCAATELPLQAPINPVEQDFASSETTTDVPALDVKTSTSSEKSSRRKENLIPKSDYEIGLITSCASEQQKEKRGRKRKSDPVQEDITSIPPSLPEPVEPLKRGTRRTYGKTTIKIEKDENEKEEIVDETRDEIPAEDSYVEPATKTKSTRGRKSKSKSESQSIEQPDINKTLSEEVEADLPLRDSPVPRKRGRRAKASLPEENVAINAVETVLETAESESAPTIDQGPENDSSESTAIASSSLQSATENDCPPDMQPKKPIKGRPTKVRQRLQEEEEQRIKATVKEFICSKCKATISAKKWELHTRIHYGICWREGIDDPIVSILYIISVRFVRRINLSLYFENRTWTK